MPEETRSSPEYLRAFTRYLKVGKANLAPDDLRVLSEGSDADGAVLAPKMYLDRIAEVRQQGLLGHVSRVETGRSLSVPYFTIETTVKLLSESPTLGSGSDYGLASGGDGSPFNLPNFGTSGSPDRRAFAPSKYGVYTKATEELLADSEPDLAKFLAQQLAISIYAMEASQIVAGTGSGGQFAGLAQNLVAESRTFSAASSGSIAVGSGAADNDLAEVLALVDPAYIDRGAWIMHPRVYAKYVAGSPGAAHVLELNGQTVPSVYGRPAVLCAFMPSEPVSASVSVIFGDLSQYLVAESKPGFTFTQADQTHIASGQIGIYARTRLDGNVVQPRAFAGLIHP